MTNELLDIRTKSLIKALAERDEARKVLKGLEWHDVGYYHPSCPVCHTYKPFGHDTDCKLTKALGEGEKGDG